MKRWNGCIAGPLPISQQGLLPSFPTHPTQTTKSQPQSNSIYSNIPFYALLYSHGHKVQTEEEGRESMVVVGASGSDKEGGVMESRVGSVMQLCR